jgi:hypothetical protein
MFNLPLFKTFLFCHVSALSPIPPPSPFPPSLYSFTFLSFTLSLLTISIFSPSLSPGVVEVLDSLNQLKVKGLVLGPLHTVQQDQADTLDLVSMDPGVGTDQDLLVLLDKAHKKGK